ncbi:pyridoxamine 5'-phosphate oxidase family protein [Gordonia sp. DT30]|uniref:pyridoxamine 5'-phosphate oxidase family protein n=1 Tax=Gordonia sp. DT30 TaxID=3416546 RepID=UPI003CF8394B
MITSTTDFGTDCAPEDQEDIDPMTLVGMWTRTAALTAPPLMSLATVGLDGYPRVRHVLLSESDATAVYFHTDSRSQKAAQIAQAPRGACALAWPAAGRQLVMHGDLRVAEPEQALRSYRERSRYLQILAWRNDSDLAHRPPAERRRAWARFDAENDELDPPPTWVGYALIPREIIFWRGDPDGPSRRIAFRCNDSGAWNTEVLPG